MNDFDLVPDCAREFVRSNHRAGLESDSVCPSLAFSHQNNLLFLITALNQEIRSNMSVLLVLSNSYFPTMGVTPFLKIMFPYLAVSPVITTAKASFALS